MGSGIKMFDRFLLNPTRGYRRSIYGDTAAMAYAANGEPWFTWFEVPLMRQHPAIRFGLRLSRTPYSQYRLVEKTEVSENRNASPVNTGNPKADAFVRECFRKLFKESLPRLIDAYHCWGRFTSGVEFKYDRREQLLRIKKIRYIEPFDSDPQVYIDGPKIGEFAGFRLMHNSYRPETNGNLIPPRNSFVFAGHSQIGPMCDMPRIAGATTPWKETTSPGGAMASRRLSAFTRAVGITVGRYPEGMKANAANDGQTIDPQDAMRSLLERIQNGFVATLPNTEHASMKGSYAWEFEQRTSPGGGPELQALIEYVKRLFTEIWLGMEIPEEVFVTGNAGSFSGRSLPMECWYGQHDEVANMIWSDFKEQQLDRLLRVNFGIKSYTADLNSLLEDFRKQSKAAQTGPGSQGGGAPAVRGPGAPNAAPAAKPEGAPGASANESAMLSALAPIPVETRQHHAAIALAMIDAKLRELDGKEDAGKVHDLIRWLPQLADDDEREESQKGINLAWVEDGTSKGGKKRWRDTGTNRLRYQESEPGAWAKDREQMRGTAASGLEIAKKIMLGEHTTEDLHAFEPHLHAMTRADLMKARRRLQATFGNAKRRDDMVGKLTAHVRQRIADANAPDEPAAEPTPRKLTGAAAANAGGSGAGGTIPSPNGGDDGDTVPGVGTSGQPELPPGWVKAYEDGDPEEYKKHLPFPIGDALKTHVKGELEKLRSPGPLHTGTKAEIDATIAGGGREIFRGMDDPAHAATYRGGQDFVGQGDYGHGRYYGFGTNGKSTAEAYASGAGGNSNGEVVRSALKPNAKIIEHRELTKRINKDIDDGKVHQFHNNAIWAKEHGYDAIQDGHSGYLNVVNPDVLHVQTEKHVEPVEPDDDEPAHEPGTDLLGRPIPKTFTAKKGQQATLEDMIPGLWLDKANEFAAAYGGKVDQKTAEGRFRIGKRWFRVGRAEDGFPITPDDGAGIPAPASPGR